MSPALATASATPLSKIIDPTTVGRAPFGVAFDPVNGNMYVTNSASNTTSVIHGKTLITTIPVGHAPLGVAFNPVNRDIYVANFRDNTVSVIDSSTNTVAVTIADSCGPWGVAFDPSRNFVLVTNVCGDFGNGSLSVIDSTSNTVVTTMGTGCCAPTAIAVDSIHQQFYVPMPRVGTASACFTFTQVPCIEVWNSSTLQFIKNIYAGVGENPEGLALNPANDDLYVTNTGSGTVSVFNTTSNTHLATIGVGSRPLGIAFSPKKGLMYVANSGSDFVSVIDPSSNTVIDTITVGSNPAGVAFDPANRLIYVAISGLGTVVRIRGLRVAH
jgi:YVTN family beta-propeller protein